MYKVNIIKLTLGILLILGILSPATLLAIDKAPVKVQLALFTKLLPFNKNISSGGDITIYVIGSESFAKLAKAAIGKSIGKSKIAKVITVDFVPDDINKMSIVYIGDESKIKATIKATQAKKVLSITGIPAAVKKGVTLGIGIDKKRPKILLNLASSKSEDITWNPAILKVVTKL